jgi:hypothetical protein
MCGLRYWNRSEDQLGIGGAGAISGSLRALRRLLWGLVLLSLGPSFASAAETEVTSPVLSLTATQPESTMPPDAPHAPIPKLAPVPVCYGPIGAVALGVTLAFFQLARKFYRFLGLGIYVNWIAAAFLALAGGVSLIVHQTAVTSLTSASVVGRGPLAPLASSVIANFIGAMVYGFGREKKKKSEQLKATVDGVMFRLIQDRIRAKNGIAMESLARETDLNLVKTACQRLLDDDIPFGNIPPDKRDAILGVLAKAEPTSVADEDLRARYRLLLSVVEVTSFKEVRAAIRRAAPQSSAAPAAGRRS